MRSFIEQARLYAIYHQSPTTRYTHFAGIPLIIFSWLLLFSFIHLVIPGIIDLTFASMFTAAILVYYLALNWRLALPLVPVFILLLWLADVIGRAGPTPTALWVFVITFLLGWACQLIGHFMEGKKPALLNDFRQALIAPLFLTAELFFLAGHMQDLKAEIAGLPLSMERAQDIPPSEDNIP